jgi:hypothetical protein
MMMMMMTIIIPIMMIPDNVYNWFPPLPCPFFDKSKRLIRGVLLGVLTIQGWIPMLHYLVFTEMYTFLFSKKG